MTSCVVHIDSLAIFEETKSMRSEAGVVTCFTAEESTFRDSSSTVGTVPVDKSVPIRSLEFSAVSSEEQINLGRGFILVSKSDLFRG
jgi:hypothetical protein